MARRHLPLRAAHAALTELMSSGQIWIELPVVEDMRAVIRDLAEVGVAAKVYEPTAVNVRKLRTELGLSQDAFAIQYGLDVATVRNWEQRRSTPDRAARSYLQTIARNPKAVRASLEVEPDDEFSYIGN